jgi:hypothetical protein
MKSIFTKMLIVLGGVILIHAAVVLGLYCNNIYHSKQSSSINPPSY